MDYLRQGIHLRGYAQKQPKQEYKAEAFLLFSDMLEKLKHEVVSMLARVRIRSEEEIAAMEAQERAQAGAPAAQVVAAARAVLDAAPGVHLDYLALADPRSAEDVPPDHAGPAVLAVAARVGSTRLIDNIPLEIHP